MITTCLRLFFNVKSLVNMGLFFLYVFFFNFFIEKKILKIYKKFFFSKIFLPCPFCTALSSLSIEIFPWSHKMENYLIPFRICIYIKVESFFRIPFMIWSYKVESRYRDRSLPPLLLIKKCCLFTVEMPNSHYPWNCLRQFLTKYGWEGIFNFIFIVSKTRNCCCFYRYIAISYKIMIWSCKKAFESKNILFKGFSVSDSK